MPITTSNGEYFEDSFDQAYANMFGAGHYDKESDTYTIDEKPEPKEIYFVRHGDTPLNKESETNKDEAPVRGWTDTPLNAQGRAEAEKAAEKLSKEPITHIVTSDLPRASETASIIGKRLGITPQLNPGLRTWDLGAYTGQTGQEVHDAVDRLCLHAPDERPPATLAADKQQLLGEKYSYPPSKYPGNINSPDSSDKLQPRENFDYIQEEGESREDFDKRIGPEGVQDIENYWKEWAPVQGGGMGWKINRPAPRTSQNDSGESFNEFKDRILTTFSQIAKDHAEHEVLVVSHNSPERILNAWDKAGQPSSGEIDRKSYHGDEGSIDPGQHKIFTMKNQIHSFGARFQGASDFGKDQGATFDQRFQGEPNTLPTQAPYFDPTNMPAWWPRELGTDKFPGETPDAQQIPSTGPEMVPINPSFEDAPMQFTPVSQKNPFDKPELAGDVGRGSVIGGASGRPRIAPDYSKTNEDLVQRPEIVPDEPFLEKPPATTYIPNEGIRRKAGEAPNYLARKEKRLNEQNLSTEYPIFEYSKKYPEAEIKLLEQRLRQIKYDKKLAGDDSPSGEGYAIKERLKELKKSKQ